MASDPVTIEQLAAWPLISDALAQVQEVQGAKAFRAIVQRLADGLIRATAAQGFVDTSPTKAPVFIPPTIWEIALHWDYLGTKSFWTTNDIEMKVPVGGGSTRHHQYRFYEIRLEPDGIRRMLPARSIEAEQPTISPAAPPNTTAEPEQKGPPVSKAALEAWYAAYQKAYQGPDDTEANALESAKGCFPNKSVSRGAVRALRGDQKRGPKPKAAK